MKKKQNKAVNIKRKQLLEQIELAKIRLFDKLINLNLKSTEISDYNQRYLGNKITNLKEELQLYGKLIYHSMMDSQITRENFVLVDYGGGSGLISLLAAEMSIGTIIYNDIYEVSCSDVRSLSNKLGLTLNHIVSGDTDELVAYLHKKSISINAITSYDVLEHIYDVESHFKKLSCLSGSKFRIVYGSGANIANPRNVSCLEKMQIEAEYKNREKKWGHKERDSINAFFDLRKKMITSYAPDLNFNIVEQLARSTRGLIQKDIEKCIDEFRQQGIINYHIDHPTNTCDPYTGNWCEHLMAFEWLEQTLRSQGFSVKIMAGRYNTSVLSLKNSVKVLINFIIKILGRRALFIAPYYVVHANFTKQNATEVAIRGYF